MKKLHKIIAFIKRTFVTDCPVCHKHFYGTSKHMCHVKVSNKHYRIICEKCAEEHKLLK